MTSVFGCELDLSSKSWFDFDALMRFVQCQHLAVAA